MAPLRSPDLREEMRPVPGPVPANIADALVERDGYVASRDAFLLTAHPGLRFHYRRGAGVRWSAGPGIDAAAVSSFRDGSVHGAVGWLNGYLPLHASAVAFRGGVHAFSGVSGEGKSTLVAALQRRGLTLFADDVVMLDPSAAGPPRALPGHKRLKLWADALALTGNEGDERVWPGVEKFFVRPCGTVPGGSLPLASLTMIETADDMSLEPVLGAARMVALRDSCYRPEYRLPDQAATTFAQLGAVAAAVPVFRFARSRDIARFDAGVDRVVAHLGSLAA